MLTRGDLNPLDKSAVFTMTDANNTPYFYYQLAHAVRLLQVQIFSSTADGTLSTSWAECLPIGVLGTPGIHDQPPKSETSTS